VYVNVTVQLGDNGILPGKITKTATVAVHTELSRLH
jgi:hypothetical protein